MTQDLGEITCSYDLGNCVKNHEGPYIGFQRSPERVVEVGDQTASEKKVGPPGIINTSPMQGVQTSFWSEKLEGITKHGLAA